MPIIKDNNFFTHKVFFICDPAVEMLCSLHVLSDYRHHESCLAWAEYACERLDKKLLKKILGFGKKYEQYSFIIDLADMACNRNGDERNDIGDFIRKLKEMSKKDFAYIFLGAKLLRNESVDKLFSEQESLTEDDLGEVLNYISFKDIKKFLKNIDSTKNALIQMLEQYWNSFFCDEWLKLKPFYNMRLEEEMSKFAKSDPFEYILHLHSDLELEDSVLIMRKKREYSCITGEIKEITLYLSVFTTPHLMMNLYDNNLSIYINSDLPVYDEEIAARLVIFTKALSDLTRFSILKALTTGSSTTKELAQKFNITPASTSQHLRVLKDSNLINFKKDKNFVHYFADNELLLKNLNELREYMTTKH